MLPLSLAESLVEAWVGTKVGLAGVSETPALAARAVAWATEETLPAGQLNADEQAKQTEVSGAMELCEMNEAFFFALLMLCGCRERVSRACLYDKARL